MSIIRKLFIFLLVLATIAAGVLFALQNKATVPLDLLVYAFPPRSVSLWVLSAFGIGGVLGMVASSGLMLRLRASLLSARRQLKRVQAELDAQKNTDLPAGE